MLIEKEIDEALDNAVLKYQHFKCLYLIIPATPHQRVCTCKLTCLHKNICTNKFTKALAI